MHYLAFDIEAANGYKLYSICSVGVVIADEGFNVISRQNIWINPKTKYNLDGTRKEVGIDLHLDKKLLDSSPDFKQVYPQLKAMLQDPSVVVVGHAVDSDVRMLNATCKHYNLPSINFKFICSQLLYKCYNGEKDVKGLGKIADEIGIEFNQHNSEEDAYMSLMTLKYLTEKSCLSVDELMQKYRINEGSNVNFELQRPVSVLGQVSRRSITQVAQGKIKQYAQSVKQIHNCFKDQAFCFSRSIELSDESVWKPLITSVVQNGGRYTAKLAKCHVYVTDGNPTSVDEMRERRVKDLQSQGLLVVRFADELLLDNMEDNKVKATDFLRKYGQLSADIDAEKLLSDYVSEMIAGLDGKGSIPMIPTYLTNVDRSKIKSGKRILIDAGGTNFRSALGYFDENGKVVIENVSKTSMPASGGEHLTKQQFYGAMASNVKRLVGDGGDVGFCFSYQVNMGSDVDGTVVCFSKEINAPEVIGTKVGAELLAEISKFNSAPRKIAVLNDTVATLLGGMANSNQEYSAYVGYIFGTGTNLCYVEDTANIRKVQGLPGGKMLINTESGNFNKIPRGKFDLAVAESTAMPHSQLLEKMSSGKYLSQVIHCALTQAITDGVMSAKTQLNDFELKHVSAFLEGDVNALGTIQAEDLSFVRNVCTDQIDRSAKIGAVINAGAAIKSCSNKALPVAIVAEGTTFNKLTGFRTAFCNYLQCLFSARGMTFQLLQGEDLNLVGTLMATMAL